jgi:hypothetical protein
MTAYEEKYVTYKNGETLPDEAMEPPDSGISFTCLCGREVPETATDLEWRERKCRKCLPHDEAQLIALLEGCLERCNEAQLFLGSLARDQQELAKRLREAGI